MQTCRNEAEVEMMESKMLINEKEYNIQPFEDLHGADLHGAKLYGADLHGADLCEANLCEVNLREVNLRRADLHGAKLYGANLYGANLYGADLHGADLREVNLRGVDLCEANLCEVNLHGADLYGADLRGAINFSKALISDCKMKQESEMDEEKGGFDIREAFRIVLDLARQMKLDNAELRACEIVEAAGESLCDEEDEENAEEQAMRHLGEGI
jgi:uncharacterized protein YjbI with pentapeptide repeats